jgi:hypothetical protein
MKSCRNCAHSRHKGGFRVDLVCLAFGKQVAYPTINAEENRKIDANCRTYASNCGEYTPELQTDTQK